MLAKIQIALFLEQQGIPISGSIGICRDRVMTVKWYWCRKTTQIKEFWGLNFKNKSGEAKIKTFFAIVIQAHKT